MVLQWRRTMEPEGRKQLSAEMQRRLADQLEWVNVTTYPFFQVYRSYVKNYPYYEQALVLFEQVWLDK
jgi:ABC-type transport system substrate-binding protein